MKNAVIFHGTHGKPDDFWFGWLKKELESEGCTVEIPHYPDINEIPISEFLPKVLAQHEFNSETVLVGHSSGGPLILSILEQIDKPIAKAILVAGFCTPPNDDIEHPILQDRYNWTKIKKSVKEITFVNSVNDPWNCDDTQGRKMFDKLGGTLIIKNDGHFGSTYWKQEYPEFPLLSALILGAQK